MEFETSANYRVPCYVSSVEHKRVVEVMMVTNLAWKSLAFCGPK